MAFSPAAIATRQKDTGDIADKAFSGGLSWDEPPFKVTAPNITQDEEPGIGDYTDAELEQVCARASSAMACRSR